MLSYSIGLITRTILLFSIVAAAYLVAASSASGQNLNITKDRIQFSDGTQQSTAATPTSARTITVSPTIGNASASGQTLRDAIDAIALANDATSAFPYYIVVEPGTFDLGAITLNLPQFVNLRGAGMSATIIRGNQVISTDPVLKTNGNGVISDLTVRHKGGAGTNGRSAVAGGESMRFQNVKFEVSGSFNPGATLTALSTVGGCKAVAIDCVMDVTASSSNAAAVGVAVSSSPSTFTADGIVINVDPALTPVWSFGVWCDSSDNVEITNATIFNTAGTSLTGSIYADSTSLVRIRDSIIETTGGNIAINGFMGGSATPVRVLSSQIIGTTPGSNVKLRNCVDGSFNSIP